MVVTPQNEGGHQSGGDDEDGDSEDIVHRFHESLLLDE
jgi:hypothetical protein